MFRLRFSQDEAVTLTRDQIQSVGLGTVNPLIDPVDEQLRLIPGIGSTAVVNVPPLTGGGITSANGLSQTGRLRY